MISVLEHKLQILLLLFFLPSLWPGHVQIYLQRKAGAVLDLFYFQIVDWTSDELTGVHQNILTGNIWSSETDSLKNMAAVWSVTRFSYCNKTFTWRWSTFDDLKPAGLPSKVVFVFKMFNTSRCKNQEMKFWSLDLKPNSSVNNKNQSIVLTVSSATWEHSETDC